MVLYSSMVIDTAIFCLLACSLNILHLYITSTFLAFKCLWYAGDLRCRFFCRALMRRMSYSVAFATTNPFRTGPVALVVGFLADIYPSAVLCRNHCWKTIASAVWCKSSRVLICGKECSRRWRCLRGNEKKNDPASTTPVHLRDTQLVGDKVEDLQYCKMS